MARQGQHEILTAHCGPAAMTEQKATVASSSSPVFAAMIPGRIMMTDFKQVDKQKFVLNLLEPVSVREISICMLQPIIPKESAIGVYYALPPFKEWEYIGPISLNYPCQFFRAPWYGKIDGSKVPGIQIGLSLESQEFLSKQPTADNKEESADMDSAQGIAQDLFTFMASFSQTSGQYKNLGDVLVIPTNCITNWFTKFKTKHARDPYFWRKKEKDVAEVKKS